MAQLTVNELEYLRTKVGSTRPTDAELQEIYDRHLDLDATARIVLETRRADFMADPASYTISGEYSQDVAANLKEIDEVLATLGGYSDLGTAGGGGAPVVVTYPDLPCVR